MTRTDRNKRVDRTTAGKYRTKAQGFLKAAQDQSTLAGDDGADGSSIALLAVHAAIAYADTVAIAYGERKSTAGDHDQVVDLLISILGAQFPRAERTRLLKLTHLKDTVAYQGNRFQIDEARRSLDTAAQFTMWAEQMYQRRPA